MNATADGTRVTTPGWQGGVARRLAGLGLARMINQAIGVAWFVVSARVLDDRAFGVLSVALALVVVIGGFSDLGLTRTIVRHVTADPAVLWTAYRHAATVRIAAGTVVGLLAVATFAVLDVDTPLVAVLLAAAIAAASGVTETAFAALRGVGLVRTEMVLLVGERALFAVVAIGLLAMGAGATAVLLVYLGANLLSAVSATAVVAGFRRHDAPVAPAVLDAEGRRTALAATLVTVAPRLSAVVLVVLATSTTVGTFSIAQKVPEALALFGVAILTPVLPMIRPLVLAGDHRSAARLATRVTGALLLVLAPVAVWLVLRPGDVLGVVFDAAGRDDARRALVLLTIAAFVWIVRSMGEQLLLADERAGAYVVAIALGAVVTFGAAVALIPAHGAVGAAAASLLGEVTTGVLVAWRVRAVLSGNLGDDTDVRAEPRGHVVGDRVQAVEHLR